MKRNYEQALRRKIKSREIGKLAQRYRQQAGVRVQDIVAKSGYSSSLIYAFENGNSANFILLFDCYFSVLPDPYKLDLFNAILKSLKIRGI